MGWSVSARRLTSGGHPVAHQAFAFAEALGSFELKFWPALRLRSSPCGQAYRSRRSVRH